MHCQRQTLFVIFVVVVFLSSAPVTRTVFLAVLLVEDWWQIWSPEVLCWNSAIPKSSTSGQKFDFVPPLWCWWCLSSVTGRNKPEVSLSKQFCQNLMCILWSPSLMKEPVYRFASPYSVKVWIQVYWLILKHVLE